MDSTQTFPASRLNTSSSITEKKLLLLQYSWHSEAVIESEQLTQHLSNSTTQFLKDSMLYPDASLPSLIQPEIGLADVKISEVSRKKTILVTCCQCGDGPRVLNIAPACVACRHEKCGYCTVEKQ
jgi:hypothetical protein